MARGGNLDRGWRRLAWFVALWAMGVAAVLLLSLLLRWVLAGGSAA